MRRLAPVHLLLGGYVAGLCLVLMWRPPALLLAAVAVAGLGVLGAAAGVWHGSGVARAAVAAAGLLLVFLAGGFAVGAVRVGAVGRSQLCGLVDSTVSLQAVVLDLPQQSGTRLSLPVRVTAVDGRALNERAQLQLEAGSGRDEADVPAALLDPTGPLTEGARLELSDVRIEPLPKPKPGAFDYGGYLQRRGVHVVLGGSLSELRFVGRRGGFSGLTDRLRLAARAALRRGLRSPVREILQGMVLGDDETLDQQAVDDFRRSGLLHIMAVSGENVVLLCGLVGAALGLVGVGRRARLCLLLPLILTYVVVTGSSPSIVRAGVAGVLVTLAAVASRPVDVALLLLVPAAVQLTLNPWTLLDVGFQLSFAAVLGLVLLARRMGALVRWLPRPLAEPASITMAASVATAPVSLATFGQASLIGVVANVAGGFVLGPVMLLGMLSVLAGLVLPVASVPLNAVAGVLITFLLTVARACARPPFAVYQWNGVTLALLLTVAGLGLLLALQHLASRAGLGIARYALSPLRRQVVVLAAATLLALALVLAPAGARAPDVPTLTVLDVGEGAAAIVQAPGGPTTLIDAGPAPLARTLRRHGVRSIDLLVLSHGHADHTGGLADVLQAITVRRALLPRPPTPDPALDRIETELRGHGVQVSRCAAPLSLACGAYTLRILPTQGGESDGNQDQNDWALVVAVELGGQPLLLPGDAEGEALGAVVDGPAVVVELPHHGSAGGLDAALLARLAPRVAVISVGPNRYGHPTAEMLKLLAAAGVPCLRTDQGGDVVFSLRDGRLLVARLSPL